MKNNSCIVVLNGHGCYSKNETIIDTTQTDYNIVFTCPMKASVSNASHNYLIYSLASNIQNGWQMLEFAKTTRFANKNAPQKLIVDMNAKHTSLIYNHGMENAENVTDVNSLIDIDPERFSEYEVNVNSTVRQWNGKLLIEVDKKQIALDVAAAHQAQEPNNPIINLSANNLLHLRTSAACGEKFGIKLSEILDNILPNIKIPVSYHQNGELDIIPCIYIDDKTINAKEFAEQNYPKIFNTEEDIYHELTIAGDANIIFDMCRDEV